MTDILDRIARSKPVITYGQFRPSSVDELFALRLAAKLNEKSAAPHYVELSNEHSPGHLLVAYRRASVSKIGVEPARRFHSELERLNGRNGQIVRTDPLMSIRIERRTIAVAIFRNLHLEHAQARQLSSSSRKAIASAATFVERVIERFPCDSVVFETIRGSQESQRMQIKSVIDALLRSRGALTSSVEKSEVLEALSNPALRSRADVRNVVSAIWPILDEESGAPYIKDAVALGLYVQTECLFNL